MSRKSGFTLLESIFSFFIVFIVLGGLVYTLRQAGSVRSNMTNMGDLSEVAHLSSLLRADLYAASSIETPPPDGTAATLLLTKVDPDLAITQRINTAEGAEDADPYEDAEMAVVRYVLADGQLMRRYTDSLGRESVQRLIACEAVRFHRTTSPHGMDVLLELRNSRRARQYSLKVALR